MKKSKLIFKKEIFKIFVIGVLSVIIFTSCKKDEVTNVTGTLTSEVVGTYVGTVKNSTTNESKPATLSVIRVNDSIVSMHCVADGFDTIMINLCYQNGEQIMLCYSDQDFLNQYGHNLNNYNFCNSKSNDWNSDWCNNNNCWDGENNWNAWINHLNTQHSQTDQHFGYFNVNGHNCEYTFNIETPTANYTQQFVGSIQ